MIVNPFSNLLKYSKLFQFENKFWKYYHHRIGVIGALFAKGQPINGTELGPKYLRQAGIIKRLNELNYDVKDFGDIEMIVEEEDLNDKHSKVRFPRTVAASTHQLVNRTVKCLKEDRICLTLGGDHSLGIIVFNFCVLRAICLFSLL